MEQNQLLLTASNGPSLLGRNLLKHFFLDWNHIAKVEQERSQESKLDKLLSKHQEIFKDELGTACKCKAALHIKDGACPKFFRPCIAIRGAVGDELDRPEATGIEEKLCHSDLAAPIAAVPKGRKVLNLR